MTEIHGGRIEDLKKGELVLYTAPSMELTSRIGNLGRIKAENELRDLEIGDEAGILRLLYREAEGPSWEKGELPCSFNPMRGEGEVFLKGAIPDYLRQKGYGNEHIT